MVILLLLREVLFVLATTLELYPLMYSIRCKHLDITAEVLYSVPFRSGKIPLYLVWIISVLLLICSGITYRVLASRLKLIVDTPVELPVPLSAFPEQIGNWAGEDVPISPNIQRAAKNDAFLNRLFINKLNNKWANVYIAYTARPRTMMGHRPDICYLSSGWIQDSLEQTEFTSYYDKRIQCLIFHFHKPDPSYQEKVVLNYYLLNGQIMADDSTFISGLSWRTPNIAGNPARYVAQIQISSVLENFALSAAMALTNTILDFFPDPNGEVRAVEYIDINNILK